MFRKPNRKCTQGINYSELSLASQGLFCSEDANQFEKLLSTKTFKTISLNVVKGSEVTAEFARDTGFREPFLVRESLGMGLTVPSSNFTVRNVSELVGDDFPLSVIEVSTQIELSGWRMGQWVEYFEKRTNALPALNVISLEFSKTKLRGLVESPKMVRDIDWIESVWPADQKLKGSYPHVQYYCLMSLGGSYTDFHVDFGGSSVWYHVLRGKKIFYLARPTSDNLRRYEEWSSSTDQLSTFFGDIADSCYEVVLEPGDTFFIPTGWIHAVYTPEDSLVFGGNFLHSYNMKLQVDIHKIEGRTNVQAKCRFPHFDEMQFYAAGRLLQLLKKENMYMKESNLSPLQDYRSMTKWEREGIPSIIEYCKLLIEKAEEPAFKIQANFLGYKSASKMIRDLAKEFQKSASAAMQFEPIEKPLKLKISLKAKDVMDEIATEEVKPYREHQDEEKYLKPIKLKLPIKCKTLDLDEEQGKSTNKISSVKRVKLRMGPETVMKKTFPDRQNFDENLRFSSDEGGQMSEVSVSSSCHGTPRKMTKRLTQLTKNLVGTDSFDNDANSDDWKYDVDDDDAESVKTDESSIVDKGDLVDDLRTYKKSRSGLSTSKLKVESLKGDTTITKRMVQGKSLTSKSLTEKSQMVLKTRGKKKLSTRAALMKKFKI